MKYLLSIISLLFVQFAFACDCEPKPELDIKDWNNADIVFKAVLTQVEKQETATYLTFSISKILKGKTTKKSINYSVENNKAHNIFHHIDSMFIGEKWIVFSSYFEQNNELAYKLNKPESTRYCMLSKPIIDNDSYLTFINKIIKKPNSTNRTYYNGKVAFAKGSLENKIPTGVWKYFTSNNLDHYWEGAYANGKRDGKWIERAINYKKEKVIINEETYQSGILKERIRYNYIREKKMHETYSNKFKKRILYYKNTVASIRIYDKISNTTTVEIFKNGISTNKTTSNGQVF